MIAASVSRNTPPRGPLNILVAENERHVVRMLQINLQREGHQVISAFSLDELNRSLAENSFDLAIVGEYLNPEGGSALLNDIFQTVNTENLNVILLVSKASESEIDSYYDAGAHLVLTKPFNPTDLINSL